MLNCAHAEAKGAQTGIGIVKLMGLHSGFIAAGATLASQEVNFTLIPEVPLVLDGKKGFLNVLRDRLLDRHHAVVVVAEGVGQDLLPVADSTSDASGNPSLTDIGLFLKQQIKAYFAEQEIQTSVKDIDPSYIIRSVPANAEDCLLCDQFARAAVHAAMAGKIDMVVGLWNDQFMHVNIEMATKETQRVRRIKKQAIVLQDEVLINISTPDIKTRGTFSY